MFSELYSAIPMPAAFPREPRRRMAGSCSFFLQGVYWLDTVMQCDLTILKLREPRVVASGFALGSKPNDLSDLFHAARSARRTTRLNGFHH